MSILRSPSGVTGIAAAAALGVVLTIASSQPAFAQGSAETESSASLEATQPGTPQLELVDQTTWVRQGEGFVVRIKVENAPENAVLQLVVHDRLTSRSAFRATFDGILGGTRATPISVPLDGLPQDADEGVELGFAVGDGGARFDREGVYPVEVLLTDQAGTTVARLDTYLLLLPEEGFPPLSVAVVVEIGATPGLMPDGTVQLSGGDLSRIRARTAALLAVPDLPLTVAPIPETLDAIAHSSGAVPLVLDDLAAALGEREVLAKPYVDIDLQAWADAGLMSEATSEIETGVNVTRTRFDGIEPTRNIWLTGATVGAADVASWQNRGIERAVVPESAIASIPDLPDGTLPSGPVRVSTGGSVDGLDAFVSDQSVIDHLLTGEDHLDTHRFLAELTMIWFERPADPRGVVVRVPDQESVDTGVLTSALEGLQDADALRPVTLTDLFETVPSADDEQPPIVELAPRDQPEDLRWMADSLERARQTWASLADSINDPDLVSSLRRSLLIAPGSRTDSDDRRAHIRRVNDAARDVAGTVSLPPEFRITLTAREGTIPVTIANISDQDRTVRVYLESNQLEFPHGDEFEVVVPPGDIRIDLTVRTRTSGAFPLNIRLTSPDGSIVLDESTFDIRSTAISGVGLVLSIGAGLFLLVWWTRHWHNSRKSSRPNDRHSDQTRFEVTN